MHVFARTLVALAGVGLAPAGCATGEVDLPDATTGALDASRPFDGPLPDFGPEAAAVPNATISLVTPAAGAPIYKYMTGTTTPYPNALEVRTNVWSVGQGAMSDQCAVGFIDLNGRCPTPVLNPTMADLRGAAIPTLSFRLMNCDVPPVDSFGRDFGNFTLTFRPAVRATAVPRTGPTGTVTTCEYAFAVTETGAPVTATVMVNLRGTP